MKMLITGGAGFIGSAVGRKALERGFSVTNIDNLSHGSSDTHIIQNKDNPNYQFLKLDICDEDALENAIRDCQPDIIIHLAAESHVDRSISSPEDFMKTNILGTFNLLQISRRYLASPLAPQNFRMVHVSTDEVFGSLDNGGKFVESSPYNPRSPYSASKAASDHLVNAWFETYNFPVILTNCSNNYGPYQASEKFIPKIITQALNELPIPIYGNGENVRDWLYVDDHADALLEVARNGSVGERYNIGSNNELSNLELVNLICSILDKKFTRENSYVELITFVEDRLGHDFRYAIDASKISLELGWSAKYDFETGIESTIEWYVNNTDWWKK